MPRVGIVFELEEGADQKVVTRTLQQLRFGRPAGNKTPAEEGDQFALNVIEPLRGQANDGFTIVSGLLGLSIELGADDANHFFIQAGALPRAIRGIKDVRVTILPKIE